jgi:hypothetical protein
MDFEETAILQDRASTKMTATFQELHGRAIAVISQQHRLGLTAISYKCRQILVPANYFRFSIGT